MLLQSFHFNITHYTICDNYFGGITRNTVDMSSVVARCLREETGHESPVEGTDSKKSSEMNHQEINASVWKL